MQSVQSRTVFQRVGVGSGLPLLGHWSSKLWFPTPWLWPLRFKVSFSLVSEVSFSWWESISWDLYAHLPPNTHMRKGRKEKWRTTQWRRPMNVVSSTSVLVSFPPLPPYPILFTTPLIHPCNHGKAQSFSTSPPPRSVFVVSRERGALEGYSLSMSLYFFRSMDTWSLNRTGSSLIWEWTRGIVPNQLANLFMQVWRWAKWSGSAQRDARELWGWEVVIGKVGGYRQCKEEREDKMNNASQITMTFPSLL